MHRLAKQTRIAVLILAVFALCLSAGAAQAKIDGLDGTHGTTTFNFTARDGYVIGSDGEALYFWGLANDASSVQYPGPTLILAQGVTYTINLTNNLPEPISLAFPGMSSVTPTGGVAGLFAQEALPGGSVSYTFTAATPGTYLYQSATNMAKQIEMGLVGAIIVRPTGFDPAVDAQRTYDGTVDTAYDYEVLYIHTEMDHRIHKLMELGRGSQADFPGWFPYYWFYNGRTAPDVFSETGAPWLPTQPYDCFPHLHPDTKMLIRMVGAGHDPHPFHTHGNSAVTLAIDGRVVLDANERLFTQTVFPGNTRDAIFQPWNGAELGWDIYGHLLSDTDPAKAMKPSEVLGEGGMLADLNSGSTTLSAGGPSTGEYPFRRIFRAVLWHDAAGSLQADPDREVLYLRALDPALPNEFEIVRRAQEGTVAQDWIAADSTLTATFHGATFTGTANPSFPVTLPDQKDLTFGTFYSGSPFLGAMGNLPTGEGGFNLNNGLAFMWHSHSEKELTTNDIFPGGMISIAIIEPDYVVIPHSQY